MKNYMAIDQYGTTYHNLGPHPRKGLMKELGYSSARKMYIDTIDGKSFHTGYIVGPYWCTIYEVTEMRRAA